MNKKTYVYIDTANNPMLVGHLYSHVTNDRESSAFEYDKTWLSDNNNASLHPAFLISPGSFHIPVGKALLGAIGDSAPDRWGRTLMGKAEHFHSQRENKKAVILKEIDYLLRVDDRTRQGALRFSSTKNGTFLTASRGKRIPSLANLPKLLSAIQYIHSNEETEKDLGLLLAPGSSLGGARAKVSIIDHDGELSIVKVPQKTDPINIILWEAVALTLAEKANITVPKWRVHFVAETPVLILKRFDRHQGNRVPFLSAMSMLGADENEPRSYLEIVDVLRKQSDKATEDIHELWRRLIFNILIANTDDHLRNHAFLHDGKNGWRLAPAYDLNPIPMDIKPRILSTTIDFSDPTGSIELAMSVSHYFGLTPEKARQMITEVETAVSGWKWEAKKIGISSAEIDRMSSAFMEY